MTTVHTVKSKMKISQKFVAFSEYMNFIEKRREAVVYNQLELTLPPPLHSEEQKEKDPWTCFSKSEVKSVHSIERSLLGQFYFTKRHTYSNEMVV